jgi:hypothetical protein
VISTGSGSGSQGLLVPELGHLHSADFLDPDRLPHFPALSFVEATAPFVRFQHPEQGLVVPRRSQGRLSRIEKLEAVSGAPIAGVHIEGEHLTPAVVVGRAGMTETDDPIILGNVNPGTFLDEPIPPANTRFAVEAVQKGFWKDPLICLLPGGDMDIGELDGIIGCGPANDGSLLFAGDAL